MASSLPKWEETPYRLRRRALEGEAPPCLHHGGSGGRRPQAAWEAQLPFTSHLAAPLSPCVQLGGPRIVFFCA